MALRLYRLPILPSLSMFDDIDGRRSLLNDFQDPDFSFGFDFERPLVKRKRLLNSLGDLVQDLNKELKRLKQQEQVKPTKDSVEPKEALEDGKDQQAVAVSQPQTHQQLMLKVDVSESDTEWAVKADLPGVEMKDVDLTVADGVLQICAHRSHVNERKSKHTHRIERSFGSVKRCLVIPENALLDTADAHMDNGVLTVKFNKKPVEPTEAEDKPRKIAIRTGGQTDASQVSDTAATSA